MVFLGTLTVDEAVN